MPTDPDPLAQVNIGMRVVDATGDELGKVTAVKMPGTAVADEIELPPADAARLVQAGYVLVDGGLLKRDLYVEGHQVAQVDEGDGRDDGVVTLNVDRAQVVQAG